MKRFQRLVSFVKYMLILLGFSRYYIGLHKKNNQLKCCSAHKCVDVLSKASLGVWQQKQFKYSSIMQSNWRCSLSDLFAYGYFTVADTRNSS